MERNHENMVVERDGEFYREYCPDCCYVYEIDEDKQERFIVV